MTELKNQCVLCGKFRKWEDLSYCAGDYSEVSGYFDEWFECIKCMSESEKERFLANKKLYSMSDSAR